MNWEPFITCAVTGGIDLGSKHPYLPITPAQIADSCVEAAEAGAAIVHVHVRDPDTGKPARELKLYREVVERIRERGTDVLINLTTGMGGDLYIGDDGLTAPPLPGTDCVGPDERIAHVVELLPDICTLDCGTMNWPDSMYLAPVDYVRTCAERLQAAGVKPELEVFDLGHLVLVKDMIADGLIASPPFIQLCLGIRYGASATVGAMKALTEELPAGCVWSGFAISRMEMPMVAQAALLGGNVRVGLEDNLYLDRGVFATNGQLVERARRILEHMGATVAGPDAVRERLGLLQRAAA